MGNKTIYDKFYGNDPVTGNQGRRWAGLPSRTAKRIMNNLGIIDAGEGKNRVRLHRDDKLAMLQAYYDNKQYDHLLPWDSGNCGDDYVKIRKRKPRIIVPFAKTLASRIAAKMVSEENFAEIKVEDDPNSQEFYKAISETLQLPALLAEPVRQMLGIGACLLRFYLVEGTVKLEHYSANYCYPQFNEDGTLRFVRVQYVYYSEGEYDEKGQPLRRWFRLDLGEYSETSYDNPVYDPMAETEPEFEPSEVIEHNLGFVQAVWFRNKDQQHSPDGFGLHEEIMPYIDELSYSMSQSSQAVSYNQDPQLVVKGMDTDAVETLIKSASKAWDLGREGEAAFVESSMTGVTIAQEFRKDVKQYAQDASRIVFLDPEKMATHAQSGKAMEVLHGPMVELVNEMRPFVEKAIKELYIKVGVMLIVFNSLGAEIPIEIPKGFVPSMDITFAWPPVFPMTMQDLQQKASLAIQLANANLFSRETMTRWLAKDMKVEDIEAELAKIAKQPQLNPFGGGYF